MKTIKILSVLFITAFSHCSQSQVVNNILTFEEAQEIYINGINMGKIAETKGDVTKMNTLFGNTLTYKTGSEPSPSILLW